jgi:hypothetical protein
VKNMNVIIGASMIRVLSERGDTNDFRQLGSLRLWSNGKKYFVTSHTLLFNYNGDGQHLMEIMAFHANSKGEMFISRGELGCARFCEDTYENHRDLANWIALQLS